MSKETSKKDVKAAEIVQDAENMVETMQVQAPEKKQKVVKDPVYSADEFAANARKIFGTRHECVAAALKSAGKSECTVSEAKKIVEKFLKREVS